MHTEEMQKTWYEMNSGVGERRSYERFMQRCQVKVYQQLGMMLRQNLSKGKSGNDRNPSKRGDAGV